MVVVFLIGGLGNQMFQYAAGATLSELRKGEEVVVDTDYYKLVKSRKYELNRFNFSNIRIATEKEKKNFKYKAVKEIFRWYEEHSMKNTGFLAQKLYKNVKIVLSNLGIFISCINDFEDVPITCNMLKHKNIYLYGYFQYPQYAYNLKNIALKFSSKAYESWKQNIAEGKHVCVHIRLGDYINDTFFGICTKDYYYKAFEYIAEKVENPIFHIFSDSPEIVKKEFEFAFPVIYEEEKNVSECLMKMSLCKYFIISNSTFSWWAQQLSQNEDKVVVAPARWYGDKNGTYYLYEKTWKLIEP